MKMGKRAVLAFSGVVIALAIGAALLIFLKRPTVWEISDAYDQALTGKTITEATASLGCGQPKLISRTELLARSPQTRGLDERIAASAEWHLGRGAVVLAFIDKDDRVYSADYFPPDEDDGLLARLRRWLGL
jgi:hypothetical protein